MIRAPQAEWVGGIQALVEQLELSELAPDWPTRSGTSSWCYRASTDRAELAESPRLMRAVVNPAQASLRAT
jgi:hypothetical protein